MSEETKVDEALDVFAAIKIAESVFETYRSEQPRWWKKMDGTPILNDVAVRMAEAFSADAAKRAERRHRNAEAAPPSVLEALKNLFNVVLDGGSPDDWRDVKYAAKVAIASAEAAEGRAKGEADGYLHDDGHFTWATPSHRDAYASQFAGWQRKPFYLSPQPPAVEGAGLNTSMATGYKHWRDCFEAGVYPSDEESYSSGWADGQAALSATPPPGLRGPDFPSFDAGWRAALELDRRTPPTVLAAFKQWQAATAGAAS